MKHLLDTLIPLHGSFYKVTAVNDDGVVTLTPAGATAKATKRAAAASRELDRRLANIARRYQLPVKTADELKAKLQEQVKGSKDE